MGDVSDGALAEYSALRAEVAARLGFMHQILGFHLTVTGSLIAFSLSSPARVYFLLLVPWLSFVLSGRYVSQEYGIDRIGEYNRLVLSARIPGALGWEQWMIDHPRKLPVIGWLVPLMVAFPGASLFALAWTGQHLLSSHHGSFAAWLLLWLGGLAMTALSVRAILWVPWHRRIAQAVILLDPARSFAAIIFDADGLLIDSERAERSAWQVAASEYGCTITDSDFAAILGATADERRQLLTRLWAVRGQNPDAFDQIAARRSELVRHEAIGPRPGVASLIAWAAELRLPLAVASSTQRPLLLKRLEAAGIDLAQFNVIISGDDVAEPKPAPDIYWLAARRVGVAEAHCLALEDSDNGVRAAHAAGTIPILISDADMRAGNPSAPDVAAMAYQTFDSLTSAENYLRGMTVSRVRSVPRLAGSINPAVRLSKPMRTIP